MTIFLQKLKKPIYRFTFLYILIGFIWVYLSNTITNVILKHADAATNIYNYKGWIFIAVSGIVLFFTLKRQFDVRKYIKLKLQERDVFFRKLVEEGDEIVYLLNAKGNFKYIGSNVTKKLGYVKSELLNYSFFTYLHPDDFARVDDVFKNVLKYDNESAQVEYRLKSRNGQYNWREGSFINKINDKDINGVVFYTRDISERKAADEKLKEKNNELNTLLYRISHDIRGPVASILGLALLAKDEAKDEEMLDYISKIIQTGEKLDDILRDISKISEIQGRNYENSLVDFKRIIAEALHNLEPLIGENLIKLKLSLDPVKNFFNYDKLIRVIIKNLVQNAVMYTKDAPSPVISISVEDKEHGINLIIEDNGIGIRDEEKEYIFDIFYRNTTISDGRGLGLYLVKKCVERMNGSIKLSTYKDEGTRFIVYIPNRNPV